MKKDDQTILSFFYEQIKLFHKNNQENSPVLSQNLQSRAGTYALILYTHAPARIRVGRRGDLDLQPGYYIYTGSAFGPGGIKARVLRHFRSAKSTHWHIDYLTGAVPPAAAFITYNSKPLEHHWAHQLCNSRDCTPIKGFGCSDCRCTSHLFYSIKAPDKNFLVNQRIILYYRLLTKNLR